MRLVPLVILAAACGPSDLGGRDPDLAAPILGPETACGETTCGPSEVCYRDCCTGEVEHCYARPSAGCRSGDVAVAMCNGVVGGCVCMQGPCPEPPACTDRPPPTCVPAAECRDACCGAAPICRVYGGTCDPSARTIECFCAQP